MISNIIIFSFKSIFATYSIFSLLILAYSLMNGLQNEVIFFITFLLNILIIYLLSFFKNNKEINNKKFIYLSLVCWVLIIFIGSLPLLEILDGKSLNEIIFYSTSLVTTTGFNIISNHANNLILSIWVSSIQIIGAIYSLTVLLLYYSFFINKNIKFISINKKSITFMNILFITFLISFTLIINIKNNNLIDSFNLSAAILSSGGMSASNSVYLRHDTNYILITILMIVSLLFLPLFLIRDNKRVLKNILKQSFTRSFWLIIFLLFVVVFFVFMADLSYKKNLFMSISFLTTTGLIPHNFESSLVVQQYSKFLFFIIFFVVLGSFSGTVCGGLKINRLALLLINIKEEFNKFLFQYNLKGAEIIRKGSTQKELNSFYSILGFGIIISFLSILLLNLGGASVKTSFVYTISALSNSGEGLIILSNLKENISEKYYFILNILMICGRFEFIGYLLLLQKFFKKS